jgi:hypothetical protein
MQVDTALEGKNLFDSSDKLGTIKSSIEFPLALLLLPADHTSVENSGVISAIKEKSRKAERQWSCSKSSSVNPLLFPPLSRSNRYALDKAAELPVVSQDTEPEGVNGRIKIVEVYMRDRV